jgi:heavy metal sensor kinase
MKLRSLKARIGVCIAILMLIVVAILSGIAYHEFKEGLWKNMDLTLQSDLQQVKGLLFSAQGSEMEKKQELTDLLNAQATFGSFDYQIWFEDHISGQTEMYITSDLYHAYTQHSASAPVLEKSVLLDLNYNNQSYRAIWARYAMPHNRSIPGQTVNIALAISSHYAFHEVGEFVRVLLIAGAIVIWAAWGLTQQILRWGLKPLHSLAEQMSHITESDLATINPSCPDVHLELVSFVTSWKDMLARLAKAMEEQKRFISDAAHELKTPIALMKSTLQLAQIKKRDTEYYENTIADALEDVDRLHNLVNQLLELSRIESPTSITRREWIHLNNVIEDVIEYHKPLLDEKGFVLKPDLCPADLYGSREQLQCLFNNLIDNAIKYAPPKTTISIAMKTDDNSVTIIVHDEGGNIPQEECSLLFDRFYRISKARDRNSGGSGLGLAIAKEIVLQHAGRIHVESNHDIGTRFVVTFPKETCNQGCKTPTHEA